MKTVTTPKALRIEFTLLLDAEMQSLYQLKKEVFKAALIELLNTESENCATDFKIKEL